MTKKVKLIVFAIALLGLFAEMMAFINWGTMQARPVQIIRSYLNTIQLSFFNSSLFEYHNFDSGLTLNYLNTAFYLLLLAGGIIYVVSQQRESRLIRFVLSLVFISGVIFAIWSLVAPIFYWDYYKQISFWWLNLMAAIAKNLIFAYASYFVLRYLNATKELVVAEITEDSDYDEADYNASVGQRILHLFLDIYLCLFIFSPLMGSLGSKWLEMIATAMGERGAIYICYAFSSLLYFTFFEMIFGATPAKFLTETRVVDLNYQKASSKAVIFRTLSRHIPFDTLSFIVTNGWHDNLSDTTVVREKRSGVKGKYYFLIIPAFLILALVSYFGHEQYQHHQSYLYNKKKHEELVNKIQQGLRQLSTTTVIQIEDVNNPYSSDRILLKVEEIHDQEVVVTLIELKNDYSKSLYKVEQLYNQNKGNLSLLPVKLSDLNQAYTPDYDQYNDNDKQTAPLLIDSRQFEIKSVDRLFEPSIHDRGTGSYGSSISLELVNYGRPAEIIDIQPIEGNVEWTKDFPIPAPTAGSLDYPSFNISGMGYTTGEKYKFKMILRDSLNHQQAYLIEGSNMEKTIQRLE